MSVIRYKLTVGEWEPLKVLVLAERRYQFDLTGDPTGNGCGVETETTCPALVQWGTLFDSVQHN